MENMSLQNKLEKELPTLAEVRDKINSLDNELINLLAKRRELSVSVVLNKLSSKKPIRDQSREQILLDSLASYACNLGLDAKYITRLFHLIIEDSVIFQQKYLQSVVNPPRKNNAPLKIAVLGGKGSYSYLAAKDYFSRNAFGFNLSGGDNVSDSISGYSSFEKVFKSTEQDEFDYAVVPFENTTSGAITEVFDLLLATNLSIIGETKYAIEHCLVVAPGTKRADIETIFAHPEASRQCNKSLRQLINLEVSLVSSSSKALQLVAESKTTLENNVAAIASKEAAELFGLDVLFNDIANSKDNCTRFFILAKEPIVVSTQVTSKISLVLSTGQKPGSLAIILNLFRDANIILSKLESRPIPEKPWEQMFYLDIEGNLADTKIQNIIGSMAHICHFVKILGCYPTQDVVATQVSLRLRTES